MAPADRPSVVAPRSSSGAEPGPVAVADDEVSARYAVPSRPRVRLLWAVIGSVVLLAAFATVTASVLDREVRWRDVGFDVVDAEQVQVTFEVYGTEGQRVRCLVRAADARYADVGQVEVDVGPLPEQGQSVVVEVRTVEPAASASVRTCVALPGGLN